MIVIGPSNHESAPKKENLMGAKTADRPASNAKAGLLFPQAEDII
jgi:hypothetical protein